MTAPLKRRHLLATAAALAFAPRAHAADDGAPYDGQTARNQARTLAASPYKPPDATLPDELAHLGYAAYQNIRFDPAQALWRGPDQPFQAQFFPRGWLFASAVELFEVSEGRARPITFRPEMFTWPQGIKPPPATAGFAGMRLTTQLNKPGTYDEIAAFLGASYFRALGRNMVYGLSARGLAINTADPAGEEFPAFRTLWLEKPPPGTSSVVVSGVIDSPSATASIRIAIRPPPPGMDTTTMDTELTVFPRIDLPRPGIATGTSMFHFDASNRTGIDDWRPAVHDSDGLMMLTGRGETLWRSLANPRTLQVSSFVDANPRGFGLLQRARAFRDYEDLDVRYDQRPGLWVEPIGDWGEGTVTLVEIPTKDEYHDNIVAFWRPKNPLRAKSENTFTYRLHWCADAPVNAQGQPDLGRFYSLSTGPGDQGRAFVLQARGPRLSPPNLPPDTTVQARISSDKGTTGGVNINPLPDGGGWRVSFDMQPGDATAVELRATLMAGDTPLTETWVYRWTT